MVKLAFLGVIIVLMAAPFKLVKPEFSVYLGFTGTLLVFFCIVDKIRAVVEHIQNFQKYIPIESTYFSILLKMIGITYITEFSSDICKDAGYGALANQIGIAGKVTLISLSIPAITSLFTCVMEWWG